MDLCLTGRMMDAAEAERSGLVARIVAADRLMNETMGIARKIASMPMPAVAMVKEAIGRAEETSLA
jgi:enoyl-CoA hydratase